MGSQPSGYLDLNNYGLKKPFLLLDFWEEAQVLHMADVIISKHISSCFYINKGRNASHGWFVKNDMWVLAIQLRNTLLVRQTNDKT